MCIGLFKLEDDDALYHKPPFTGAQAVQVFFFPLPVNILKKKDDNQIICLSFSWFFTSSWSYSLSSDM